MRLSLLLLGATMGIARGQNGEARGLAAHAALMETPIMCPKGFCLHRIAEGDTADSFSCEQFVDEGHVCAAEGLQCHCDGFVKYGNFEDKNSQWKWSEDKDVKEKIMCDSPTFAPFEKSGAKVCYCTPRYLLSWRDQEPRNTTKACSNAVPGYYTPQCVSQEVRLNLESTAGLDAASIWEMGYNKGAASVVTSPVVDMTLGATATRVRHFDKATLGTMMVTPCLTWEDCAKFVKGYDAARADPNVMNENAKQYIYWYPELGSSIQAMKDYVNFEFVPKVLPAEPAGCGDGTRHCGWCVVANETETEAPSSGAIRTGMAIATLAAAAVLLN